MHRHRTWLRTRPRPFSGAVRVPENKRAHGGHSEIHTCSCGATKRVNRNGAHSEHGKWEGDQQWD
jgi:hypothetical protein